MKIFITGSAGFIGFHIANLLLKEGFQVFGYDGMTAYYDVTLKKKGTIFYTKTKTTYLLKDYLRIKIK